MKPASLDFGLSFDEVVYLTRLFAAHPEIEKAIFYGSRAYGTQKPGSDVDIALVGESVTPQTVSKIHFTLEEESPMLLFFDVLHLDTLTDSKLKSEILNRGKVFYERQ